MTEESPVPNGMRILVIVSRPLDLPDLPNLADQWALQSSLRRVQAPAFLKMLRPPTVEGLRAEILNGYDIVHFDGHGAFGRRCPNCGGLNGPEQKECGRCEALLEDEAARGYFAFEREDGLLDALAAEELAEMVVSLPESAPKLVFLSACQSAKGGEASLQSALLKSGVPAVLGMKESVSLTATMDLAGPFYAGLGAGMTIAQAFKNALPALKRLENGSKLQKIPVLDGPGKDARILPANATGKASFEAERLFGLPEQEFVGDYIRADPPKGRKGLLSQTMDALQAEEKLVVLTGQGGIGKTVLAAEASRRLAWHYPGGIFWRSAADMKDLDLDKLLNAFENIFGPQLRSLPLDQKRDTVLNYLRNYDTASLLVVDNAESIEDDNLWRFLEGIPQPSAALVTTRNSLPREGKEIRIPEMEPGEATRLLWLEARRRSPHWGEHLSAEDLESLNEIAGVMKGHPLAIKITAALLSRRSLSSIRDELRRNPPKEVWERFDVSFNSLSERQRHLFCRLAVFSSSMTEEAVGSICIESADSDWQSDLGELERMSFLDRFEIAAQDQDGNEVVLYRYKLHPLMRQYATGKAGEELLARLRPRAGTYFLAYAQKFADYFFMLNLEHENLLAAMDWFAGQDKSSSVEEQKAASNGVLQFMSALDRYLDTLGYWKEYDRSLRQAIAAAEVIENLELMAGWAHNLGFLCQKKGDFNEAKKLFQQNLKYFWQRGDKIWIYKSLHHLAILTQAYGDCDEANKLYQQCLEFFKDLDDKVGVATSLHQLGTLAQDTGDYDEARKLYQQSLEIQLQLGDKSGMSASLHRLGTLAQATGDYDLARTLYQQSLEIEQQLGDKRGVASSLHRLGTLAQATGDYDLAKKLCQQSLWIQLQLGDKRAVASSLHQLGTLAQATGDYDAARKLYQQSLEIQQQLGDKRGVASSLHQLGTLAQATGDYDAARKLYQQSLEIAQQQGDKEAVASSLHQLGTLAQATGDYDAARKLYQQSLEIAQQLGDKSGVGFSFAQLALMEEYLGKIKVAVELTAKAESVFNEINNPFLADRARKQRERLESLL